MRKELADENEIKAALLKFYYALNEVFKGDASQMEELWSHADDTTYLGPRGGILVGWRQISETWKEQAALHLEGKVEPKDIHIIAGTDLVVIQNEEVGSNFAYAKEEKVRIRATNIFRREGGKWKMVSHQTDLLPFLSREKVSSVSQSS